MNEPILCFTNWNLHNTIINDVLQLTPCPATMDGINSYLLADNRRCHSTVVVTAGGMQGFMDRVQEVIAPTFTGLILLFDREAGGRRTNERRVILVRTGIEVADALQLPLTTTQREAIRTQLNDGYRINRPPSYGPVNASARQTHEQHQAYADRFAEAMMNGRHIEPPPEEVYGASTVVQIMRPDPIEGIRLQVPVAATQGTAHMVSKLKAPTAIVIGSPICCTCQDKMATVAFIPCGHQSLCDECTRTLIGQGGQLMCVICRAVITDVLRVYT